MKEIFKDIQGYEGLYQVSNLGNVKSLGNGNSNNSKERILKARKDKHNYLRVDLSKQGKQTTYNVHRLVAQTFLPNPQNLPMINHKDENPSNNCVLNLEWCDALYNANYGTRNQRIAVSKNKQVQCIETGVIYKSTIEVQRQLGFRNGSISNACTGKRKTCGGFTWRYVS